METADIVVPAAHCENDHEIELLERVSQVLLPLKLNPLSRLPPLCACRWSARREECCG